MIIISFVINSYTIHSSIITITFKLVYDKQKGFLIAPLFFDN